MVEQRQVPQPWRPPPPTNQLVTTVLAPAVALSGEDGQIDGTDMDGLLVADVRVLTAARLTLDGLPPHHLAGFPEGPGRTRFVAVARTLGDPINDPTIRVDRARRATPDGMRERIRVRSTATRPVRTALTVSLGCDLTPLEVAKYGGAPVAVRVTTTNAPETGLTWSSATVTVDVGAPGAEVHVDPTGLTWTIDLDPGEESTVDWWVRVSDRQPVLAAPTAPVEWVEPGLSADDGRLARLLHRSLDDLQSLRLTETEDPAGTFLGAGAPWFLTLFGRDSISRPG